MTDEIKQILKSHGEMLESQSATLKSQSAILESHGEMLRSQGKTLNSHSEMLKSHGEQLDLIATKVAEHDEQLDRITRVVVEHTGRLERIEEKMATRDDMSRITNTLDRLVKLAETKDQETTLIARGLRDVEDQVKINTKDIQKMKPALGLN